MESLIFLVELDELLLITFYLVKYLENFINI